MMMKMKSSIEHPERESSNVTPSPKRFIADVHLGTLARYLRLAGFDTSYSNSFTNKEIEKNAIDESRILLSKNIAFDSNKELQFFHIAGEDPKNQFNDIISKLDLKSQLQPLTRCLICNSKLVIVDKETIIDQLQINTINSYQEFWQCEGCKKVYWKGAHYNRMIDLLKPYI